MPLKTYLNKANGKKRELSLDILRGLAVIAMILAHVIAFVYEGESNFINALQTFGDTICFTTFLFVSGASSYIAYINTTKAEWEKKKKDLLKRLLKLLLGYYLVAFVSALGEFDFPPNSNWIKIPLQILVFIKVPGYTEFLLPFILFGLLIFSAKTNLKKLLDNTKLLSVIPIISYFLGFLIYKQTLPGVLENYKSILAGSGDIYRFPLLQYLGVFLIGCLIGKILEEKGKTITITLGKFALATLAFVSISALTDSLARFPFSQEFGRWPPTLSFLGLGLTFCFAVLFALKLKIKTSILNPIQAVLTFFGQRALSLYIIHIIILQLLEITIDFTYSKLTEIIAFFFVILIISSYISFRLFRKNKKKKKSSEKLFLKGTNKETKKNRNYLFTIFFIILISIGGILFTLKLMLNETPDMETVSDVVSEVQGVVTERPSLETSTDRSWILKGTKDYSTLSLSVKINDIKNPKVDFEIESGANKGKVKKEKKDLYTVEISADDFEPGTYKVFTRVASDDRTYESEKYSFTVSYPVYVAWTMDWEGADTFDEELENIEEFSKEHYDAPITHMFNPLIYATSELSDTRINRLTEWIKMRETEGDEIGLHIHMRREIVEASGVGFRSEPQWTDYLTNGHDVPCSAYTVAEQVKIYTWAENVFAAEGLGTPTTFRAGGWFADEKTLEALELTGFKIDTSGRDYMIWGASDLAGHWSLANTTQPYKPSRKNQNSTSPAPNFTIWEFPNNGANSTFYQADELIKRFDENYTTPIPQNYVVITYLSHAHALSKEEEVLKPAFDYIDQYHVDTGNGPVVYYTLINIKEDIES